MGLFKTRYTQLKEYMSLKKDEASFSGKLVKRYRDRSKKDHEYEEFKRSIVYSITELFDDGKSKIVIQPKNSKLNLYEKLLKDVDFTRYYACNVTDGNSIEITMKSI